MASIAVRVRMRGSTVNRSAGQDAAMRSRLQDTAPFRLPQNLLATFLLSECRTGVAPSGSFTSSRSSRASCCAMSGLVDVDQATISLLPKSYTGVKQALPQGCLNTVTSVPIFCHGAAVEKSRPMTFSNVSPTAPLYELYPW